MRLYLKSHDLWSVIEGVQPPKNENQMSEAQRNLFKIENLKDIKALFEI